MYESEVLNLFHDAGRLVVPHHYYRNDRIARLFFRKTCFRPEVTEKLPPIERILGLSNPAVHSYEDLSPAQRINHIADNLGRFTSSGELITVEEVMQLNSGRRYVEPLWPSERAALKNLNREGFEEWANRLVIDEVHWLQKKQHLDFTRIREHVWDEYTNSEHQQWLADVIEAQSHPAIPFPAAE